jgi:hypothetical protein
MMEVIPHIMLKKQKINHYLEVYLQKQCQQKVLEATATPVIAIC